MKNNGQTNKKMCFWPVFGQLFLFKMKKMGKKSRNFLQYEVEQAEANGPLTGNVPLAVILV